MGEESVFLGLKGVYSNKIWDLGGRFLEYIILGWVFVLKI